MELGGSKTLLGVNGDGLGMVDESSGLVVGW